MLAIEHSADLLKTLSKIKDGLLKLKIKKQILKIIDDPSIGKPIMFGRKGTREVYVAPYRLAYCWLKNENKLIFLRLYHKDKQ